MHKESNYCGNNLFLSKIQNFTLNRHGFISGKCVTITCWTTWEFGLYFMVLKFLLILSFGHFEKAFGRVPLNCLIYKSYHIGIKGKLQPWIVAFSNNKIFRVRVDTHLAIEKERCVPSNGSMPASFWSLLTFAISRNFPMKSLLMMLSFVYRCRIILVCQRV